jgi:hydrogenase maturation protease
MSADRTDVLLICYGNPGRLDDGLGAAFAEGLQGMVPDGVEVDVDYQLTVEHAAAVAEHRYVIFVDASVGDREPFFFRRLVLGEEVAFSTHSVKPEAVLAMASQFFGAEPEGYALGIRGYEFNEFGEFLSPGAMANLTAALKFLLPVLEKRNFSEVAAEQGETVADLNGEIKCKTEST